MDEEIIGKLHGYIQWFAEAHWQRKECSLQKTRLVECLKKQNILGFEKNNGTIAQLKNVIEKKQLPSIALKIKSYEEINEILNLAKMPLTNMHAELFTEDIVYGTKKNHENSVALHDSIARQSRIVNAITVQTFEDLLPHLFFLYEKEKKIEEKIQEQSGDIYKSSIHVLTHLNKNYFERLKKLAGEKKFHEDHKEIFVAAYILGLCSHAIGNDCGIDMQEYKGIEPVFLNNIAPYQ